jgi:hypothetical protein
VANVPEDQRKPREKHMSRGFKFWTGDVNWRDYGGTWARKVGPRAWHFIVLTNMDDACGRDNAGRPTYVVELREVDLDAIGPSTQVSAWQCCDGDCRLAPDEHLTLSTGKRDMVTADCCNEYGAYAPLHSAEGNNAHKAIRECRAESYRLTRDTDAHAEAMARPVNKLGSTAAEYMTGDMTSAMLRGLDAGDPGARIMAKAYSAADGQTLGGAMPEGELAALRAKLG